MNLVLSFIIIMMNSFLMYCSRSLWTLYEWINESSEKIIHEKIGIEPGDVHRIVEVSNWLISSIFEISKLLGRSDLLPIIFSLQNRDIGRARARSLYSSGIRMPSDISAVSESRLSMIPKIGAKLAKKLKKAYT